MKKLFALLSLLTALALVFAAWAEAPDAVYAEFIDAPVEEIEALLGDGEEALPAFDGEAPAQVLAGEDIAAEADAQDAGEELLRDSGVDGNITWKITDRVTEEFGAFRTLTLTGAGPMNDYTNPTDYCAGYVHAPWMSDSKDTTTAYGKYFRAIEIGQGITHIGSFAFDVTNGRGNNIREVVIPDSVTSIGDYAFFGQFDLDRVVIPASVTDFGKYVFHSSTVIACPSGSAACQYAQDNGHALELTDLTVTLSAEKLEMTVGETATLGATVSVAGFAPTFRSQSPGIASVDESGLITALQAGCTSIIVQVGDSRSWTCAVQVKKPEPTPSPTPTPTPAPSSTPTVSPKPTTTPKASVKPTVTPKAPTAIKITQGKKKTTKVGKKLTLKVKLTPSKAKTKLTWKSSNKKVATVSSKGVVKAKKPGKAKITVTTANGKKATITITVKKK